MQRRQNVRSLPHNHKVPWQILPAKGFQLCWKTGPADFLSSHAWHKQDHTEKGTIQISSSVHWGQYRHWWCLTKQLALEGNHQCSVWHHCPLLEAAPLHGLRFQSAFNYFFSSKTGEDLNFPSNTIQINTRLILNNVIKMQTFIGYCKQYLVFQKQIYRTR